MSHLRLVQWRYSTTAESIRSVPNVVRAMREGLLETEVASGDIYDDYGWQLFPSQRSRLLLDVMATGMKAAGTLESAQQRVLDTWGTPR